MHDFRGQRKRSNRGMIAEAVPVLMFIMLGIFPVMNCVQHGLAFATAHLITRRAAERAACASTYGKALSGMYEEEIALNQGLLGRVCKLSPIGGYNNCGAHLYVVATDFVNTSSFYCGPDSIGPSGAQGLDPNKSIFEYLVMSKYEIVPLVSISLPFLRDLPIVGTSTTFTFQYCLYAETSASLIESISAQSTAGLSGPAAATSSGQWSNKLPVPKVW